MSAAADKGRLTAWERWELADLDQPKEAPPQAPETPPEPEVTLPTAEDIERIHQQAHEQGYRLGFDEGTNAGYQEGQAKAQEQAQRLAQLADRLENALSGLDSGVADELLALSVEFARQVVRHEIHAHPEGLLDVVRTALGQVPHQHAVIMLNPEDASLVRSFAGEQLAHAGHRIIEDDRLSRGDCIVEAGGSHVDATVTTRWRRVLEGLGVEDAWIAPTEP